MADLFVDLFRLDMSTAVKILSIVACIILGYALMYFGYNLHLPTWLEICLFIGGVLLIIGAGIYGLRWLLKC